MSIQYARPGVAKPAQVKILTFPPARRLVLIAPPDAAVSVYLHWTPIGSLPCLGDECWYHGETPFLYHYTACAVEKRHGVTCSEWEASIMPVCESNRGLLTGDKRLDVLQVSKPATGKTGVLTWETLRQLKTPLEILFNTRVHMESFWKIQTAKLHAVLARANGETDVRFATIGK